MTVIAISRGTLSGGEALARLVGSQLGYPVVSREEIVTSADWFGIPMGGAGTQAGVQSYWDRLAGEREAHLEAFQAALCERVVKGNLVYHGHAGHLLIRDVPVLRVRAVADREYRIVAVMRDQQISREAAEAHVVRVDLERREWVRYLYGVEWEDSTLYDVVLNLSHMSLESACSVVIHMSRREEYVPTAKTLETLADTTLRGKISAILAREALTAGLPLAVKTHGGTVTISGVVSQEIVASVPSLLAGVEGIKEIRYDATTGSR